MTQQPPALDHTATLVIQVDPPIEVGQTAKGRRRLIPISGGTVSGPGLHGTILPGGADFQLIETDTFTRLEARYVVETDEGERIYIDNIGIRTGSAEDIARLASGEAVDPSRIYFRSVPTFETASPRWAWLQTRLFIGVGSRFPDRVELDVFQVQ